MTGFSSFLRDQRAASAAEFAMVLPVMVLFLLGIIDVGRFAYEINQAEKATQSGARWAVVTDMIPSGLASYSFATSGGIEQGTVVQPANFPGVSCTSNGTTTTCTCASGGTCSFPLTASNPAFLRLVERMSYMKGGITAANVVVDYSWSGLGFSGDPNGSDVAPITTVRLRNLTFTPITFQLFGSPTFTLPSFAYSLTMEDGSGSASN
jgi:hypothetical protein